MAKSLTRYYQEEKKRVIEKCKECGVCAKKCPIIKKTELADVSPQDIQKQIKAYLETGEINQTIFARAFSCMECFKCIDKCCPEGLNPLLVNEIIKWEYRQNKIEEMVYGNPKDADSAHRVLASIQTSPEEYLKITSPSDKDAAEYVFFPGCNVYWQPEKLISALDIMDLITDDWAFVPGLDFCCGSVHIYNGSIETKNKIQKTATLHEACKSAFTGVDLTGAREILQKLPGVDLVEMPRHGKNTVCCGSGAEDYFPNSFKTIRDDRLAEAAQTHADIFVDVCHHCHNVF